MINKSTFIKKVSEISIGSGMSLILLGTVGLQGCRQPDNSEADYEVEESYTKGVKTFIKETEPGKFKITEEISVPADSSKSVITYLDGRVEELSKAESKAMIDKEINQNPSQVGQGFGLGNVLLYGGMGYLLARTLSPSYRSYRPDYRGGATQSANTAPMRSKYYSDEASFRKSGQVTEGISKSRTFSSRPSKSRSGFFKGSSGRGFGG